MTTVDNEQPVIHPSEDTASRWVAAMMPVRVLDGAGTGMTMDEGYVIGYLDCPSILLLHEDGTQASWGVRLPWQVTGPPTPRRRQEELIAARQPRGRHLPGERPRTWGPPPEPPAEVTAIHCNCHGRWERQQWAVDRIWALRYPSHPSMGPYRVSWPALYGEHIARGQKLTDATGGQS